MRDPATYRGARRDNVRRQCSEFGLGENSFVDIWRTMMPEDTARAVRLADWKRYTDKVQKRAVAREAALAAARASDSSTWGQADADQVAA